MTWKWIKYKCFGPEPRRFLSEQEYRKEADEYTQKELEKLKAFFMNSPRSQNWKLISKLQSPTRVGSFIAGESEHVSFNESIAHSAVYADEDEEEEDEEEEDEECSSFGHKNITADRQSKSNGCANGISPIPGTSNLNARRINYNYTRYSTNSLH